MPDPLPGRGGNDALVHGRAAAPPSGRRAGGGPGAAVVHAGPWRRLGAAAVDALLIPVVWYLASFVTGWVLAAAGGQQMSDGLASLTRYAAWTAGLAAWWLYCVFMERSASRGTVGKVLLGIGVTDSGGKRLSLGRAAARNLAKAVSGALLPFTLIMVAFTGKKQALHDLMAGTLVVTVG